MVVKRNSLEPVLRYVLIMIMVIESSIKVREIMPHANQSQHNCWACDNPQGLVVLEAMEVFPAIRTLTNQPKIDP